MFQLAKCLKYLGHSTACDFMFVVFMVSWFIARHVLYLTVCYSVYAHTPEIMPYGCFTGSQGNLSGPFTPPTADSLYGKAVYLLEPLWNPDGLVCYDDTVKWGFLSMLLFLQALTIMWFSLIIRVAVRVLKGEGADDTRSDDEGCGDDIDAEDDEDEVAEYVYEETRALAEEVGVDELDLKNWAERRRATAGGVTSTATGVSLPGHSDRKELLGRIGCEKQVE